MLNKYLDNAISILQELIVLTEQDIKYINQANHHNIDQSVALKNELVKKFEFAKKDLDLELINIARQNTGSDLSAILSDEIKDKLGILKDNLNLLQQKNKEYAKSVRAVKEFYDSLLKTIFDNDTKESTYAKDFDPEKIFKIRV